jgi:hypothetical protein
MAQVISEIPSSFRGYRWQHAGDSVEMPDDEAAELLAIAGPAGGYAVAPPKKTARKAVSEPAPKGGFSEVAPEGGVAETRPKASPAAAAKPAAK